MALGEWQHQDLELAHAGGLQQTAAIAELLRTQQRGVMVSHG